MKERFLRALFVLLWAATMEAIGLGVVCDVLRWIESLHATKIKVSPRVPL